MISASTCESGVCSDWFDIASSPCAGSTVTVTSFATNLLGDGPPSQPIEIDLLSENGTSAMAVFFFGGGGGGGEGGMAFQCTRGREAKSHVKSHTKSQGHSLNLNMYMHVLIILKCLY